MKSIFVIFAAAKIRIRRAQKQIYLRFCRGGAAAAQPKREKGPENGGPQPAVPAVCDGGSQSAKQPVAAVYGTGRQPA
ncbi:hypothetical protein [uncultured Alistipes sp.]|uniref:hypothetical protein n=2 Tax=uncultured Alistipes sp. TaxID=538949 RepID=UPI00262BFC95|nr:hypothetical protein [uncultured Alistipes sp.]